MATPLQYSCLEKSMDRGAWRATVHGVAKRAFRHDLVTKQRDQNRKRHSQAPLLTNTVETAPDQRQDAWYHLMLVEAVGRSWPHSESGSPSDYGHNPLRFF